MGHAWEPKWIHVQNLGKGGQGTASLVRSADGEIPAAVLKTLHNNKSPQARARMLREVYSLNALSLLNANVPSVLDHNTETHADQTELFIVMSFVEGETLKDTVKTHGVMSVEDSVKCVLSLCQTVSLAHSQSILHRDIKPENLIVSNRSEMTIFVVDYGLACQDGDAEVTRVDEQFKNHFLQLPETTTSNGNRRSNVSDVTAVCGILLYCLTGGMLGQLVDANGHPPHRRKGMQLADFNIPSHQASFLDDIFNRAFVPHLSNRIQSIDELISMLDAVLKGGDYDENDPVSIAKLVSGSLRRTHTATKVRSLAPEAQKAMKFVEKFIHAYHGKLENFSAALNPSGFPDGLVLTGVSGRIGDITVYQLSVTVENNPARRFVTLGCFHIEGEECVLLAISGNMGSARLRGNIPESQEVVRFRKYSDSIGELVGGYLRRFVSSSIQSIGSEILGR